MTFPLHISAINTKNLGAKTTIVVIWLVAIIAITAAIAGWDYSWTQQVIHESWTTIVGNRVYYHHGTYTHGLGGKMAFCALGAVIWCVLVGAATAIAITFWREQS